eukprot:Plantae.Rhodophyta-Palmaria_palmata.ctg24155.p1 GENE.Plantae.Rhodophyta-Palmaria_palmata.ctg24155~~Plantae.Rhodophyta-Palmaria_palmata.ctg24155.p1  ORF type:complete len:127 (-),score=18.24 Plantae.Rhodophyta-Palmaria_palmata.ctg24155:66-446(-)
MSKTIPFSQITDCQIVEAAGNTCLCVKNTLHTLHIDTASREGQMHALTISGLRDPVAFKKLIWAMKRSAAPQTMDRGDNNEDVAGLLRDIRDELRLNNKVLQNLQSPSPPEDILEVTESGSSADFL